MITNLTPERLRSLLLTWSEIDDEIAEMARVLLTVIEATPDVRVNSLRYSTKELKTWTYVVETETRLKEGDRLYSKLALSPDTDRVVILPPKHCVVCDYMMQADEVREALEIAGIKYIEYRGE